MGARGGVQEAYSCNRARFSHVPAWHMKRNAVNAVSNVQVDLVQRVVCQVGWHRSEWNGLERNKKEKKSFQLRRTSLGVTISGLF